MKKIILLYSAFLCSLSCFADETPGIIINKSDGSSITVATSSLRSIKFNDGKMVINMKDDSQQLVSLEDITNITFEDIVTAISSITEGSSDSSVTVSDLSGRILFKGNAKDKTDMSNLRGIYIITANGKSHKVKIGK